MTQWIETALQLGFDAAVPMNPRSLTAREDVRDMCAADKCGAYGKNWTCPPAIGSPGDCQARMRSFRSGILVQTLGHMQKAIDSRCYRDTEKRHIQAMYALRDEIRKVYPDALCLGAGGCRVCKTCAYPEPCRFPEKAMASMEGYGLFVTEVCREAGIPYYHGERTVTYTGCVLFGKEEQHV